MNVKELAMMEKMAEKDHNRSSDKFCRKYLEIIWNNIDNSEYKELLKRFFYPYPDSGNAYRIKLFYEVSGILLSKWKLARDAAIDRMSYGKRGDARNKLLLVQHQSSTVIDWHGFTVKKGNYYGYFKVNGISYPVFWSGWVAENDIYLYFCETVPDGYNMQPKKGKFVSGIFDSWHILMPDTFRDRYNNAYREWSRAQRLYEIRMRSIGYEDDEIGYIYYEPCEELFIPHF